jgi:parallel beta-helix repeat protein
MKALNFILAICFAFSACNHQSSKNHISHNQSDSIHQTGQIKNLASVLEPLVDSREISVGGSAADVHGFNSASIQVAVEAMRNNGGGTVKLLPGIYDIIAPVKLYSNISLVGSGPSTILKKCKGIRSEFAIDADYGELEVTVKDPSGFKAGMGIAVFDSAQRYGYAVTTGTIASIKNNVLHIDNFLLRDYVASKGGTITNGCSVISAVEASNFKISNLCIDGSRESNDLVDGCTAGGIYLFKVKDAIVENVIVKNFNCDGITWQISENITVRNCEVFGCTNAGLHPGTGSPFTTIEGNNSHNNDHFGLFICWRVRQGIVRNNHFHHNGQNGICTGHKDTDMLFTDNHIELNEEDGVNFRGETKDNAPNRSVFRNNLVENNGIKNGGYGFSFMSPAERVILENNIIRNNKDGKQLAAICVYPNGIAPTLKNNQINGHSQGEVVNQKSVSK